MRAYGWPPGEVEGEFLHRHEAEIKKIYVIYVSIHTESLKQCLPACSTGPLGQPSSQVQATAYHVVPIRIRKCAETNAGSRDPYM